MARLHVASPQRALGLRCGQHPNLAKLNQLRGCACWAGLLGWVPCKAGLCLHGIAPFNKFAPTVCPPMVCGGWGQGRLRSHTARHGVHPRLVCAQTLFGSRHGVGPGLVSARAGAVRVLMPDPR